LVLARQARAQHLDAKAERLTELLECIRRSEPDAKIILFMEFVATQQALRQLCEFNGFSTILINGSMLPEARYQSLRDFRSNKRILISTDAGGEKEFKNEALVLARETNVSNASAKLGGRQRRLRLAATKTPVGATGCCER
jgi:superfamily II DNA/RNA helicase